MLIEIGHFALVLALIFSILLVVLPSIGIYQNKSSLAQLSKPLVWGQCFWITVAFFVLMSAFLTNDFSVKYVAENSNTQLPILYKASAVWGAHEGSLLLWVFVLSLEYCSKYFFEANTFKFTKLNPYCIGCCEFWFFTFFALYF